MNDPFSAVMPITERPPVVFVEGKGSRLFDATGKPYLDFVQGWAVNCLGHSPTVLVEALHAQAQRLINPSPAFYNAPMVRLAQSIAAHSDFDQVFFANSGAEANEGAIKLARKWGATHRGGAYEIITTENAFHGRTLATMSASGKPQWRELFEPKVPGFVKAPFNDLAAVERAITDKTVAVMLEPVQGEAGVIPADAAFLEGLRDLTQARGLLLIFDEVQTGIGRLGTLFGYQAYGVAPDIMTLGKGLGGGVPISALVTTQAFSCFEPGDQGGTYNGNPLMAAAACAVFDTVAQPGFLAGVRERGDYLRQKLEELSRRHGMGEVRGKGLLLALQTGPLSAPAIVRRAMDEGLLLNAPRPHTLRFMPALNVTAAEIDEMIGMLDGVIVRVAADGG